MIRVIVAEDEYFARKVLVKMLQELEEDIEIIGETENGQGVLEMLKEQSADMVITDIQMPEMDGLELAKEISEQFPDTCVIIETGFAEFEYATQAIKYGVKDYLLKPIKTDELLKSIRRVQETKKKDTERMRMRIVTDKRQHMDFTHVLENENLNKRILHPFFEKMQSGNWYLAVVQCKKRELTDHQIQNILEILGKTEGSMRMETMFFYPKEEFILAVSCKEGEKELVAANLRKKIISCHSNLKLDLEIGLSSLQKKCEAQGKELAAAYREAVYAINQRLLNPGNQLYFYGQEVSIMPCFSQVEERNLEYCLNEGKVKEAEHVIEAFFEQCRTTDTVNVYSLFISLVQIINVMNRVYNQKQDKMQQGKESTLLFSFKTDLYIYRSLDEIKDYICQILRDVCGVEGHKSSIIEDLLKYLEWNYQYDITVNDLAMHKYFVNPSYLSRLFKAETGQAFSKYLVNLRMKKAAQVLENSDLKVSDVAMCVGYNDVSYFIQTFKKYYNVTPEQYKKNLN